MRRFIRLCSLLILSAAFEAPHDDAPIRRGKRRLIRQETALPATLSVAVGPGGIDCSWSDWSAWSFCSATCGEGLQERKRWVAVREQLGGAPCSGASEQHGPCGALAPCNESSGCAWESWQDWSLCTASCEGGRRQRVRAARSGASCSMADGQQAEACGPACDDSMATSPSCWTEWSSCSETCSGIRSRKSKDGCPAGSQEELCNLEACDCRLSDWSDWSACSGPCQNSQAVSVRKRHVKEGVGAVSMCNGTATESKACDCLSVKETSGNTNAEETSGNSSNSQASTPVDCSWAEWQAWQACSTSCGAGTKRRSRTVQVPGNDLGKDCVGEDRQTEPCKGPPCPTCQTTEWSSWSECTGPCTFLSSRSFRVREPINEGNCDKSLEEERACVCRSAAEKAASDAAANEAKRRAVAAAASSTGAGQEERSEDSEGGEAEAIDCQWATWHDWEACTKSCNTGITRRTRDVLRPANALGKECLGENRQTRNCNEIACPCAVGPWSDWSTCSGDCEGQAVRSVRTRAFADVASKGHCTDVLQQEKACACAPVTSEDDDTMTAADLRARNLDVDTETKAPSVEGDQRRVSGNLELKLHDPVSFSSDPNAETAVQNTLKDLIGSLKDSYTLSVSLMPAPAGPNGSETVDCWYSLILPEEEADAVAAKLHSTDLSDATQRFGEELSKLGVSASATATRITATVTSTLT